MVRDSAPTRRHAAAAGSGSRWVGSAQFAGVNQTHEQVADAIPILGLVEQRVLAVPNRSLRCAFAKIVVQRRSRLPQKQREPLPVLDQIPNRHSQSGVGFHFLFRELGGADLFRLQLSIFL